MSELKNVTRIGPRFAREPRNVVHMSSEQRVAARELRAAEKYLRIAMERLMAGSAVDCDEAIGMARMALERARLACGAPQ